MKYDERIANIRKIQNSKNKEQIDSFGGSFDKLNHRLGMTPITLNSSLFPSHFSPFTVHLILSQSLYFNNPTNIHTFALRKNNRLCSRKERYISLALAVLA